MTDLDALCADYLSRLDAALSDRPKEQRVHLVEQITEHLHDARAELPVQSEAAVRSILERLGRPEDIAAALSVDAVERTDGPRSRPTRTMALVAVVLFVGAGVSLGLLASGGSTAHAPGTIATTTTTTFVATPATVVVPVVIGDSIPQATIALQSAGLAVQGVDGDPNGRVVSQAPWGGSMVPSLSQVVLNTGTATTIPPSA
jgi:uncharacterized membrane protein